MTMGPVAVAAFEPTQSCQDMAVPLTVMLCVPVASVGQVPDAVGRLGGLVPPPLLDVEPLLEPELLLACPLLDPLELPLDVLEPLLPPPELVDAPEEAPELEPADEELPPDPFPPEPAPDEPE